MGKESRMIVIFVTILGMFFLCSSAYTADYPNKAVRLIVTADVGGGEDTEARGIAPYLEKHLGVKVVIENQGAAGGKIAFERFKKTEPDGYSLITYTFPKSIIIEYTDKVIFKTKEYTPVYTWSYANQILAVNAETWKTFDEFLKAAKAKTLAGGVSGGHSILGGLVTADELGINVNWVPYEGSAGSLAAVAGKHIDFMITLSTSVIPLVEAGKLRPLALFSDQRDPYLPNVPCTKELGIRVTPIPGIRGIEAPPNTSPAIVKILEEALSKTVKEQGFIDFAKKRRMVIRTLNGREYGEKIAEAYPLVEKYRHMLTK